MKLRRPLKITGRTSSVTNSFVQAIIPAAEPTVQEIVEALDVLGMTRETLSCVYCGGRATDWDHLRPLVKGKRPTGYITEIKNLVPACGACNQSKGGAEWRVWINSKAKGSPKTRGISDIDQRVARLNAFESWGAIAPLPLKDLVGTGIWDAHWANLDALEIAMREAQMHAAQIKTAIQSALELYKQRSKP